MSNVFLHPAIAGDLRQVAAAEAATNRVAVFSTRAIPLLTRQELRERLSRRQFTHSQGAKK